MDTSTEIKTGKEKGLTLTVGNLLLCAEWLVDMMNSVGAVRCINRIMLTAWSLFRGIQLEEEDVASFSFIFSKARSSINCYLTCLGLPDRELLLYTGYSHNHRELGRK